MFGTFFEYLSARLLERSSQAREELDDWTMLPYPVEFSDDGTITPRIQGVRAGDRTDTFMTDSILTVSTERSWDKEIIRGPKGSTFNAAITEDLARNGDAPRSLVGSMTEELEKLSSADTIPSVGAMLNSIHDISAVLKDLESKLPNHDA